jgi:outer membrane protein
MHVRELIAGLSFRMLAPALTLLVAARPAAAQVRDTLAQRITFGDAVRIALQRNITLRQAENSRALSAVTVQQQKNVFLPSLALSTTTSDNVGQSFSQTEGRLINQNSQALQAGVSSNVTLFNGFQNFSLLRQARFSESASTSDLARARQTVVFTVASNFLSLVTLQEQQAVQDSNHVAQQAQLTQVQALVTAGRRSIADLYQQQAAVALARSQVVTATRAVELAKVDLIQTLQLDPRATYAFTAPAMDSLAAVPMLTLDGLLASAFSERADLTAATLRVDAATEALRTASSTRWPQVGLNLGYNTAYSSLTAASFAQQLDQRRGGSIGLSLAIPLFDRGASRVASQSATIQAENARLASERQRQTVALDVRRAFLDYQSAVEQINATRAQTQASDLALSAVQERYRVGAATLAELSLARAAQVSAASALVSARYTLIFQQSLMSYYTGTLDPATVRFGSR